MRDGGKFSSRNLRRCIRTSPGRKEENRPFQLISRAAPRNDTGLIAENRPRSRSPDHTPCRRLRRDFNTFCALKSAGKTSNMFGQLACRLGLNRRRHSRKSVVAICPTRPLSPRWKRSQKTTRVTVAISTQSTKSQRSIVL